MGKIPSKFKLPTPPITGGIFQNNSQAKRSGEILATS